MYTYDNYQNKSTHILDQQRVFEMFRPSFVEPLVITPLRLARVVLPDLCKGTNCKCASPNGFGEKELAKPGVPVDLRAAVSWF